MAAKNTSFSMKQKLSAAKLKEFSLVEGGWNYRNREDITTLPPNTLVAGSQNVLTNTSNRIGVVKGYSIDGAKSSVLAPILSSFDWRTAKGYERHLRAGFLTSAGNDGKLQFRYVDSTGTVTWIDLLTGLSSVNFNFTDFWDYNTEKIALLLAVNGQALIYDWSGAITTFSSATASSITKQGTTTWAEEGFYTVNHTIGDSTTQFDITNPIGTTFRYTYDGTGTDPLISATTFPIGAMVKFNAQNFNAANNGVFTVTGSSTNYIEVTNASGVAENNKTIGTGAIYKFLNQVTINGTVYTYISGTSSTTLTGVTPDPSAAGYSAGTLIYQTIRSTPNVGMTSLPLTGNDLIGILNNQVYVGQFTLNDVYVSKVNSYTDYSFSSPRLPGEGAIFHLGSTPKAFAPQENEMYLSGVDEWYQTVFTLSADLVNESLTVQKLKTAIKQSAYSQAFVTKDKNDVVFLSTEPVLSTLGRVSNILQTPQIGDLSYPIINDMNAYDFGDGSCIYWKNYLLVAVPKENLIRIFNQTNPKHLFWEAPVTYPISCFSIIGGELYGHSYQTSETYKLFSGYTFRVDPAVPGSGIAINAIALFAGNPHGVRFTSKGTTQEFVEGYMSQNGTLTVGFAWQGNTSTTTTSADIKGSDIQIINVSVSNASLGKKNFGKNLLGGDAQEIPSLPPYFHVIKTFTIVPFYFEQTSFSSFSKDFQWELISFGMAATPTKEGNLQITQ